MHSAGLLCWLHARGAVAVLSADRFCWLCTRKLLGVLSAGLTCWLHARRVVVVLLTEGFCWLCARAVSRRAVSRMFLLSARVGSG